MLGLQRAVLRSFPYPNSGPNIPGVGAFQARPGQSRAQEGRLKQFLEDCLDRLVGADGYQEETGLFP
jgi:hypothetical protein